MSATVVLGQQGRLVIPADVRAAMSLQPGDKLRLHVSGHRLVLESQQEAALALQGMFADSMDGRSWVDELIAERRAEAAAE